MKAASSQFLAAICVALLVAPGNARLLESKPATTSSRRELLELENLGWNPDPNLGLYPLKECQGNCEKDAHCAWGLTCPERTGITVEGCEGTDDSNTRYCVQGNKARSGTSNTGANGATVLSVQVISSAAQQKNEDGATATPEEEEPTNEVSKAEAQATTGTEQNNSSASSPMVFVSAALLSISIFVIGLF